jgi:hypothetical protein
MSDVRGNEDLARLRAASAVHAGVDANHAVERPRRTPKGQVESFGDRRVCATIGCGTVLSRYTRKTACGVHDGGGRA